MADYLTTMVPAIDAAAEGRLRCDQCGLTLTVVDPTITRGASVFKVTDFDMWVEPDGTPKGRCKRC